MSRWRLVTIAALMAIPIIALTVIGSWYLWSTGLARLVWWPLAACFICGYVLAWRWQRTRKLLYPPEIHPPVEWTDSATGHRVLRLSQEPGSRSLYFHQNAFTATGDKMVFNRSSSF